MKKLNLLIIVALLATALLAAAPAAGKLYRLRVINNTGADIYIKLEGENTDAFYYLTIPEDEDETFTVMSDVYKRTTWTCDGIKTTGKLIMTGNLRLNFVECYVIPWAKTSAWVVNEEFLLAVMPDPADPGWDGWTYDPIACQWYRYVEVEDCVPGLGDCSLYFVQWTDKSQHVRIVNQGEPGMEKVQYFTFYDNKASWADCGYWKVKKFKVRIPTKGGCYWRYRY